MSRFTMEEVGWEPRLPPVEEASATPEQIAAAASDGADREQQHQPG